MFGKGGVIPSKISRILGAAMWGYDLTGGGRVGKTPQATRQVDEALAHMPTLPERPAGLGLPLLRRPGRRRPTRRSPSPRTAALDHGAVVANDVSAVGISKVDDGRADGVEVAVGDRPTASGSPSGTRSIVNAGGVWADEVRTLDEGRDPDSIRPAKGIHITVPWHKVRNDIAAVIPVPKDRRSVFVVPWGRFTYIGTTDTDYDGPVDDPQCTEADVDYLLSAINAASTETITTADVVGTWAGLRPLVKSAADRPHRRPVATAPHRSIRLGRRHRSPAASSRPTARWRRTPSTRSSSRCSARQIGFAGFAEAAPPASSASVAPPATTTLAESARCVLRRSPPASSTTWPTRYGGEARALMAAIQADPTLAEPIVPGLPYTQRRGDVRRPPRDGPVGRRPAVATHPRPAPGPRRLGARRGRGRRPRCRRPRVGRRPSIDASVEEYRASVRHEREAANLPETHLETLLGA